MPCCTVGSSANSSGKSSWVVLGLFHGMRMETSCRGAMRGASPRAESARRRTMFHDVSGLLRSYQEMRSLFANGFNFLLLFGSKSHRTVRPGARASRVPKYAHQSRGARCEGQLAFGGCVYARRLARADQRHARARAATSGRALELDLRASAQVGGRSANPDGVAAACLRCHESENREVHDRHAGRDAQPRGQAGTARGGLRLRPGNREKTGTRLALKRPETTRG